MVAVPEVVRAGATESTQQTLGTLMYQNTTPQSNVPTLRSRNNQHAHFTEEEAKAQGGYMIKWHGPPTNSSLGPEHGVKHFMCIVSLIPHNVA